MYRERSTDVQYLQARVDCLKKVNRSISKLLDDYENKVITHSEFILKVRVLTINDDA